MASIGSLIFQEKLINFFLTSKSSIRFELIPLLKIEYFESIKLQEIARHILSYFEEHHAIVPLDYLLGLVSEETGAYLQRITLKKLYYSEEEDVKNKTREFVRKQVVRGIITDVSDEFSNASYEDIRGKITQGLLRCEIGEDKDLEVKKDFETFATIKRETVSTGWKNIDILLGGGVAAGEIAMVAAGPGGGKSQVLVGRVCEAQKTFTDDKDCAVYITCELADSIVAMRAAACLTEIEFNTLRDNEEARQKARAMLSKYKGVIKIKEYPSATATVSMIRGYLEKLRAQGYNIRIIAIDYPEEMALNVRDLRLSIAALYRQLRALSHKSEFNCPIWVASQINRGSYDQDIITHKGLAEAFAKAGIVDIAFGLSTSKLVLLKNRAAGLDHLAFDVELETSISKLMVTGKGTPLADLLQAKGIDDGQFQKHLQKEAKRIYGKESEDDDE